MPETLSRDRGIAASAYQRVAGACSVKGAPHRRCCSGSTFLPTLLILYLFLNWLPTLVIAKGFDSATAPRTSMAFNFGSVAGALVFGRLVDRFHFRWPLDAGVSGADR